MIGAVHYAFEIDAVRQGKHAGRFMGQHPDAATQQQLLVPVAARFTEKGRIIAGKREYPDTIMQRRLAEYEIPAGIGIEVFHGECCRGKKLTQRLIFLFS